MASSPKQKYSIFKPKDPNFNGGSSRGYGNRNKDVGTNSFPTTPTGDELFAQAEANFKPAQVDTGDAQMWSDLAGKVNLDYTGITGTSQVPVDTSALQTDIDGKKVGPYIPNNNAPNIKGNPDLNATGPGPSLDYNEISAVDKDKYVQNHGVFTPKDSSGKSRVTLGDTLKKGKSKNT
jgi:hypothetical protein